MEQHDQQGAVRIEIESAAQSIGGELHEALAALPFDAVDTRDTTALTPEALFGSVPGADFSDATDLDDAHGVSETLTRSLSDPETGAQRPIAFQVRARVAYVEASGGAVAETGGARTLTKRVEIAVTHPLLLAPVRIHRVHSL
ncbi:MAG: hypothetical protein AAFQ43_09070 [Bacteroidota bacterium]